MVIKNVEVGKTKDVTLIELGKGDVKIAPIQWDKEECKTGVSFVNDVPNPIGTNHNDGCCTTDETNPNAMITFTNIESLEVLEKAIHKSKVYLRNLLGIKPIHDSTYALNLILSGKMAKREVVKTDTVIVSYKERLYQLCLSTRARYPYVLTNADIHAKDWIQVFPKSEAKDIEVTCNLGESIETKPTK